MKIISKPDATTFGSSGRTARRVNCGIGSATRFTVLALLASAALPQLVSAQTVTWNGPSGNFAIGANWDTTVAPTTGDTAVVGAGAGTVTVNSSNSVTQLNINGGTVEIVAPSGALTASTGTRVNGGILDIHNGASLSGGYLVLDSGSVTNNGAVSTTVDVNYGSTFTQDTLGTISGVINVYDGTFNNNGTITTIEIHSSGTLNNNTGSTATTVTNNGTLSNSGTITTLNQQSGTFTNNSGGTLSGTLTVTGGTANNAGTLGAVVNQSGSTFNNTGTAGALTNNGTATNTGTLSSVSQVAGSFANNAGGNVTGTVTLSGGSMTNAGTAGTVDVQSGNSFTNTGTVTTVQNRANSTFVNNGTATTVNNYGTGTNGSGGTITTLNQISGTFTNASGSTVSGTTTISGGTLTNAGTLGAVTNQSGSTFTNNGTAGAVTNAGTATNSGTVASLTQSAGTFTNNSGATITGSATVSGGTLTNAGTVGAVTVQSGATFTNSGTAGALTNAGTATNTGTIASLNNTGGTFTNSGNGSITGTVTVDGSTLINNGSSLGNIQVLNGGFLKGAGNFGTITISSGATIAPGNSIGTSRISGNLVFQNGSFYEVEIDPTGASDLITVTGSVTINGGTVTVLAASGNYQRSNEYQIITSGTGVTGTFSTVTSNLAFLDPTVVYRGNNVYLRMERNDIRFQSIGLTPNQRSIGLALDNGWAPAGVISAATGLSVAGARTAFDDLSGDIYPSLSSVMLDESQGLRNTLTNRMAGVSDSPFWLEGYGAWNRHFSNGNASAVTTGTGGVLAGADAEIAEGWRLGAAGGYGFTRASATAASADADINTYSAAFYLEGTLGPLSLRSGAAYSFHDVDVDRTIVFGGLSQQPSGDFDAATRQVFAELAYGIDAGDVKLEPFANLAFVDYRSDAVRETGGSTALNVSGIYDHAFYSLLGVRVASDTTIDGMPVKLGGLFGWQHAYDADAEVARMNFTGQRGFDIGGVPVIEDRAVAELKATVQFTPAASLELSWQGTFAEKAFGHRAGIRLGVSF